MSLISRFLALVAAKGSDVTYHRESGGTECPCRTDEGFRDPKWHLANPLAPLCNEEGYLASTVDAFAFKGFVQPIQSTRATKLTSEQIIELVGEIQEDDHLGIFPMAWGGNVIDLTGWDDSGTDFIGYNGDRYTIVNVNVIPDPSDGNPNHHQEVGMRLLTGARSNA